MSQQSTIHPAVVSAPGTTRRLPVWAVALAAVCVALAVWAVAVPLAGVTLEIESADGTTSVVGPAAIVVAAALAVLLAWPVRAVCARAERGPQVLVWRVTCGVVLLVSLVGPLGATTTAARVALTALHLAVGAAVVVGLDPRRGAGAAARQ